MVATSTTTITLNGHKFTITISGDDVVPPTNIKAKAGPDFTANIMEGQPDITVSLDGSQSTGDITKVVWAQQAGPATVKIKDDSKLQTDFVASVPGVYSFILAVGDSSGAASTDGLVITVTKAGQPPPPPPPPDGDKDPGLPTGSWIEQPEKGADKNPHTWGVVTMVKDPALFKVVDSSHINVAVEFATKAAAEQYIDHFIYVLDHQKPPVDHHCLPTQHWDEAQQKCVDNPPGNTGAVDLEGIQMIYEDDVTKSAQQFYLKREGPNHKRVDGKGVRKLNADGTVSIAPDPGTSPASARLYIFTTTSDKSIESQMKLGKDWKNMLTLPDPDGQKRGGWMVTDQDYRDTELSYYYRIPKIIVDDEMTNYIGGHHPSDDTWPENCVSSCYKLQLQTKDCSSRSAIEWDHLGGSTNYAWNDQLKEEFNLSQALGGTMANKLIGQKFVRYNKIENGELKAACMEMYIDLASMNLPKPDLTKQDWKLFVHVEHDGTNWPTKPKTFERETECNAKGVTIPGWGSDSCSIRYDESPWIIYNLSVRPIIVKKK